MIIATPPPSLTVVIPAFNEALRLPPVLDASLAYLQAGQRPWELIVVDDGSTDDTSGVVRQRCSSCEQGRLRLLRADGNGGKGAALRAGAAAARGDRIVLVDADGATPLSALPALERALDAAGCGVAVGSRSDVLQRRPPYRRLMSGVFSLLATSCVADLDDTQCGLERTLTTHHSPLNLHPNPNPNPHQVRLQAPHAAGGGAHLPAPSRLGLGLRREGRTAPHPATRHPPPLAGRDLRRPKVDSPPSAALRVQVELLYLAQQLDFGVVSAQVPWRDVPGSKVRPLTPLRMAIDVARVRLLYSTGRWRVPPKQAEGPQQAEEEAWPGPEYVEQHDVASMEQVQRALDAS